MTDFPDLYDRFLSLIDNDVDRAEVKGHIAKMCATGTDSPEHKQSRRQLVRVLKSRAPHALPPSWLMNPSLEDGPTVTPGEEIRKDWKDSMETEGLFFFGRTPTWEDIDKHYGSKGWGGDHRHPPAWGPDKRGVKPPHAPRQKPHGNEVGVRHMVVRLAALPEFRDNHEKLAELLGRPGAAYRELVQFKGDDAYRQRLQEVYDGKFPEGSDLREAADEGAQMGGENFKLSAGSARGRRADEHQDPTVNAVDAGPALSEAKDIAADPDRGLSELDDAAKTLLRVHTKLSTYSTARGPMNAIRSGEAKLRSAKSRYQRLRNSGASTGEKLAAAQKVNDAAQDLLVHMGALQEVLADNSDVRAAIGADEKAVAFLNKHLNGAHAVQALTRAMLFTAKHEWNVNDAKDHERPAGPDEGADTYSFYGVPMNELEQMWDDIREAGLPGRLEFRMSAREERAPAPAADPTETAPTTSTETDPTEAAPTTSTETDQTPSRSSQQADRKAREVAERMKERGVRLRPEFQGEAQTEEDQLVPEDERFSLEEMVESVAPILREEGLSWSSEQAKKHFLSVVNGQETGGAYAKAKALREAVLLAARGEDGHKIFRDVGDPAPETSKPKPGVKPAAVTPDATPADKDWSTTPGAMPKMGTGMREVWRNQLADKISDEEFAAKYADLERKLSAVKADDKLAAREQFINILEEFLKGNELPSNVVTKWREQLVRDRAAAARLAAKKADKPVKKRLPMNGTRLPLPGGGTRLDLLPQTTPDP